VLAGLVAKLLLQSLANDPDHPLTTPTQTTEERVAEACRIVEEAFAPVYGWFTEGFDTADLKEAKALLEALAA
jgi:predicted ATPase